MGRMALPRHHDHAQISHRREHARPRPHDDVVSPIQDLQPPPISRSPVSPDQQPHTPGERFDDRRRGRRNRRRLGNQHDRPPPSGQTAAHDLDDRRHLVLRRRPKDEGARTGRDGCLQTGSVAIRGEEVGGRCRRRAALAAPSRVSRQRPFLGRDTGRRDAPRLRRSGAMYRSLTYCISSSIGVEERTGGNDLLRVERACGTPRSLRASNPGSGGRGTAPGRGSRRRASSRGADT